MRKPGVLATLTVMALILSAAPAIAGHNGAVVGSEGGGCDVTTVEATITDPAGTHKVSNMYLVVHADGVTEFENIPIDGSAASIAVGPFTGTTTVMWHVFGGGERSYDIPLWNGFGGPTFGADIAAYAAEVGGFGWVIAGPDDPNPFVTWNEFDVEGCSPEVKDDCRDGGWETYGFRNQGLCVTFVETGMDSR